MLAFTCIGYVLADDIRVILWSSEARGPIYPLYAFCKGMIHAQVRAANAKYAYTVMVF